VDLQKTAEGGAWVRCFAGKGAREHEVEGRHWLGDEARAGEEHMVGMVHWTDEVHPCHDGAKWDIRWGSGSCAHSDVVNAAGAALVDVTETVHSAVELRQGRHEMAGSH